jgi:hypothetical protein
MIIQCSLICFNNAFHVHAIFQNILKKLTTNFHQSKAKNINMKTFEIKFGGKLFFTLPINSNELYIYLYILLFFLDDVKRNLSRRRKS